MDLWSKYLKTWFTIWTYEYPKFDNIGKSPPHICFMIQGMFKFTIMFTLWFKAHGWVTFSKCEARLGYHLILGP